jgi:transposase-like protein
MTTSARSRYAGHRFPPEVISHAIWLYFPFPLNLRMEEEMLAVHSIVVSHKTMRQVGPQDRSSVCASDPTTLAVATSSTWSKSSSKAHYAEIASLGEAYSTGAA